MLIVFYQRIRVFVPIIGASLLVFILANCARESRPTGGMKDTTAPQVVLEKPLNNSVLVAPKKVVIAFNESVTLDKIQEQCIISPSLSEFPKISAKKNKVTISLHKTTLQPNTTYSFTFSKAIKDVNEGNTLESYSYAFSTSSVIDSCKIAGKVLYAQSLNIPKNAYVLLYSNLSESAVKTQKPNYITQVTRDGSFQFNNIAAGTYAIYALEDANRDFMFNQATEKIAFLNQPITPTAQRVIDTVWYSRKIDSIPQSIDSFATKYITRWSHQDIELYLFENKIQQLSIYNAKRISQFSYGWKFSKQVSSNDFSVTIPPFSKNAFTTEILDDSVIVWFHDANLIQKDEAAIIVTYGTKTDTLHLFAMKEFPNRLKCELNPPKSVVFPGDTIQVRFQRPIQNYENRMYMARVKDTTMYSNMWNKPHVLNNDKVPEITKQIAPLQQQYSSKFFYQKQDLLSYKIGLNRCALYFAQPISVNEITLQLEAFPNITNWYELEQDVSSNAILCWITHPDIMKLKNICFTVEFMSDNKKQIKTIEFNPGFSKKDSFKRAQVGNLIPDLLESQKKELLLDNAIQVVCNNPIQEFSVNLFSLVAQSDTTQTSCISKIELYGKRSLLIYYSAKPGTKYILTLQKNAITDVYGSHNKQKIFTLQTQTKNATKLFVPIVAHIKNKDSRNFLIQAPRESGNYAIIFPKASCTDIYGDVNDSIAFMVTVPKPENFGTLQLSVTSQSQNIVIQLYKKDSKSKKPDYMQSQSKSGVFSFVNVQPGEYTAYAIFDNNCNQKWDTGSLEQKEQPEKIEILETPIIIKANWDNVVQWKID